MSDIKYNEIKSVNFADSVGKDINDNFVNIDKNFQNIISADYLKGAPGHSVTITTQTLSERSNETLINQFVDCIVGDSNKYDHRRKDIAEQLEGCKVVIINGMIDDKETQLSSLPFGFKDTKYDTDLKNPEDYSDLSCIIYYNYDAGKYENLQMFPSLYYDEGYKNFCWLVNGQQTGLVARGPQGEKGNAGVGETGKTGPQGPQGDPGKDGKDGAPGSSMLIASYEDTADDKIKTITKFYYQNSGNWGWISTSSASELGIPLIENSVILACKETDNDDKEWCWGLLHNNRTGYELIYGGLLSNVIGADGMNLLELMKHNDYFFIPTTEDKQTGHLITKSDQTLEIGLGSSDGNLDETGDETGGVFKSNYKSNEFNGDVIINGTLKADMDVIATGAEKIIENDRPINVGNTESPTYFENGVPVECDSVAAAKKLSESLESEGINMGSKSKPVYFENGVPVECNEIVSGNADTSKQLMVEVEDTTGDEPILSLEPLEMGSETKPVYFAEGVPVECGDTLEVSITGHAETAGLASSAVHAETAGLANEANFASDAYAAETAKHSNYANLLGDDYNSYYTSGNERTPVYFKEGIPVECGKELDVDITGKSIYASEAEKLKDPVTISICEGATGTPTDFDGSQDISIPITKLNGNYLTWDDDAPADRRINPIDFATNNYLNPNRLSFIPTEDILIQYSNDEGNNWEVYNLSNEDKISFVTTGLSKKLYLGAEQNQTVSLDRLRITIDAPWRKSGSLCCSAKKLMFHTDQNNVKEYKVELQTLKVGKIWNDAVKNYTSKQYDITGEDGWYSIPLNFDFGGSEAAINNIRSIRIVFYFKGEKSNIKTNTCMVDNITLHGEPLNDFGHPLAKTNNICSWDAYGNAAFDKNLIVKENIYAKAIEVHDVELDTANINKLKPESGISSIGEEGNYWPNAYIDDIKANYAESVKCDTDFANIGTANIGTANITNIINNNVAIQNELPDNRYPFTTKLKYEISNNGQFHDLDGNLKLYEGIDPKGGTNITTSKESPNECLGELLIKTSQLDSVENDTININIPNLYIPIGLTYINDYYLNLVGTKKWANINMTNIVATVEIEGVESVETVDGEVGDSNSFKIEFPDYTLPLNENYHARKRNGVIYYAFKPEVPVENLKLKTTQNGYSDCKIRLTSLSYTLSRDTEKEDEEYKKGDKTRVNYTYVHGLYIGSKDIDNWYPGDEFNFNTDIPIKMPIIIANDLTDKGDISCNYYSGPNKDYKKIYFSKDGILMVNGFSKLKIIPPTDYNGSGKIEDSFGYIEVSQYNSSTDKYITKRKSLYDLLS